MTRYAVKAQKGATPVLVSERETEKPLVWFERGHIAYHTMGDPTPRTKEYPAGVMLGSTMRAYDVRIVAPEDEERIRAIDEQIRALQEAKRQLVRDRFLTWRPLRPEDCAKVVPGKTKREALAAAKGAEP